MPSETFRTLAPTTNKRSRQLPTFLEHVYELRRRLFWVVAAVFAGAGAAYAVLTPLLDILTRPLGGQPLFYLTPGGSLSFSFKVCAYAGAAAAVPVIMYHVYWFIEPLMGDGRRSAIFYVGLSALLAVAGILFAYFISLPAALHFLTGFNVGHIQAMLTADSYLAFVVTYLLGAALLFQIPLLLLIINTMTPLKPQKLMKLQKFVIVGAFILGAIFSPTPDITNQAFLAIPIIAMYEIGVVMVWIQNTSRARRGHRRARVETPALRLASLSPAPVSTLNNAAVPHLVSPPAPSSVPTTPAAAPLRPARRPKLVSDVVSPRVSAIQRPLPAARLTGAVPSSAPSARRLRVPARSVDGFMPYRQSAAEIT